MKQFVVLMILGWSMASNAYISVGEYLDYSGEDTPLEVRYYVEGLGNAYVASNVVTQRSTGDRLFCQPPALALRIEDFLYILDESIQRFDVGDLMDVSVELFLLDGLQHTFPCNA